MYNVLLVHILKTKVLKWRPDRSINYWYVVFHILPLLMYKKDH